MTALSTQIISPRLLLRAWQPQDRAAFAAMNADIEVMRYFPAPMTEDESNAAAERYNMQLERDGYTMFAVEERESSRFVGVIGAQQMRFTVPGLPAPTVEIGWRLALHAQGKGFATEGARAVLDYLRDETKLTEVYAVTAPDNIASQRVMHKLGMKQLPALSFDHPLVAPDSPRRRHVLFSMEITR
jgi:RimJ/RimL family protein N-acetyltransferase